MKNLKFLHISHDDKFIDYFINDFNFKGVSNKYLIYTESQNTKLKHIKNKDIIKLEKESLEFIKIISDLNKYDAVFIHFLTPFLAKEVILKSKRKDIFLLMFWGAEVFMHPEYINEFYLPSTKELLNKIIVKKKFKFAFKPKNFMLEFHKYNVDNNNARLIKKSLKRINYFCHWIPEDYNMIRNKFNLNAKYLNFFYNVMQNINSENNIYKINTKSKNILIGNSASESNNHIDIFEKLKSINFESRKIYVPLSYAEYYQGYVNAVIKKGKELFNDNFHPITDFLNSYDYYSIIYSCDYIIMPHLRSQAGANIISGLFYGKKCL